MNIYFLVEGRTEQHVYPKLLSYLVPNLKKVDHFDEVAESNYFIFTARGYPSILDMILTAVEDINAIGRYSHLVVCLDADEATVQERIQEVERMVPSESDELNVKLVIIVQNRCFETWFLGNGKVYPRNPQDETFKRYCKFYNVSKKDPELMPKSFDLSYGQFHKDYLKKMLKEKNIHYTEQHPRGVGEEPYIKALQKRVEDSPEHLKTLQKFFSFCENLRRSNFE